MREIKFRAFVKDIKKVFPVHSLEFSDLEDEPVEVASCGNVNCGTCTDFYELEQVELMQYTGLKDKNGVEIYEWDIVRIMDIGWGWNEKVIFHNGAFMAGDDNLLVNINFRCIVIGNIYENSELLEVSE